MQFIKDLYQEAISVFARSWFEKIIPILESNGNVRLRQVGSQGLVKQAIKMDELQYTLDQINDQLDNQNRGIEADPSLKKSFEVMMKYVYSFLTV